LFVVEVVFVHVYHMLIFYGEHSGTYFIWTCTDTLLMCIILIGAQIVLHIRNLTNTICDLSQLSTSANVPVYNKKCTEKFTIFYYITRFGNTIFSQTAVNLIGASEQKLCCTSIASSSKLSWHPSSICINKINKMNINKGVDHKKY
jgi:hypothetical protein